MKNGITNHSSGWLTPPLTSIVRLKYYKDDMINIIGFLILVTGFCFPYLTHTYVPSTYFFWVGSLLSLNKGIIIRSGMRWAQAAQVGILINIAIAVTTAVAYFLIGYGSITRFEEWIQTILYWISSPATAVGQKYFHIPKRMQMVGYIFISATHELLSLHFSMLPHLL